MTYSRWYLVLCMVCAGLWAGCNVFEGLYEEGDSDDPGVLMQDAQAALERGEPRKAVTYLEKALQQAPEDPVVKVELASTLLKAHAVDVLLVSDVVDLIVQPASGSAAKSARSAAAVCNFHEASHPGRTEILLDTHPKYLALIREGDVIERVRTLLTGVVSDPDVVDRFSSDRRARIWMTAAVANIAETVIKLGALRASTGATLWNLPGSGLGLCASSQADLEAIHRFIKCDQVPNVLDPAVAWLEARQELLTSLGADVETAVGEALDAVKEGRADLLAHIPVACPVAGN